MCRYFIRLNNKGFTLVEVLAVFMVLGLLAAIAVPSVIGLVRRSEEEVCMANRAEFERWYLMELELESNEEGIIDFQVYLRDYGVDICPVGGEISYTNGVMKCSIHSVPSEDDNPGSGDVPFL